MAQGDIGLLKHSAITFLFLLGGRGGFKVFSLCKCSRKLQQAHILRVSFII